MAEDLGHQIDWAFEVCALLGIARLSITGVEADDTIGSIAKWGEAHFKPVYLCTSDKDMAQLVNDKIQLLNTHKDNLILGSKGVEEQFGVRPDQILDYLALTGDASDNIPGVTGFGAKSAASLLKEFDTLDNALHHLDKIPGKKGEMLKVEGEQALLSRRLALIDLDVDFPKRQDFFSLKAQDRANLFQFYNQMSFHSLSKEIGEEKKEKEEGSYRLIDSEEEGRFLKKALLDAKEIAFSIESTSDRPMQAELVGIGFSRKEGEAFYIPLNGSLGKEKALALIKEIFQKPVSFFAHNAKYDWIVLKNYGIDVEISFDTMLASYLLNANERQHSIDALSSKYLKFAKMQRSELTGKGKQEISMSLVPLEKITAYCSEEVDFTFRLKSLLAKEIEERGLNNVYFDLELPLLKVLAEMEMHGIYLDAAALARVGKDVNKALEVLKNEIFAMAGEEFNLNSPKQLSEILFIKLLIRPPKKTATGYSTSQEVLEELKDNYPIAEKLIEWRILEKLRSTYIETLPQEINPKTGRIHTTFNQFVAATGRLSSQDPNLQNIPTRNPMGQLIREAFRPQKEGWSYLACDYSQIELRLLAHFSEDEALVDAFMKEEDIHATTAALILGVPLGMVTREMRHLAKAVNFGVLYGQGPFGLSQAVKIDLKEAKKFIETYFARFPRVKNYIEESKEKARRSGKTITFTGRERPIPEILNKNMQIRAAAERLAVNTPLQGGAADLIKMAMLKIQEEIKKQNYEGYMVLQVHDELIFEAPDHEIPKLQSFVKRAMEEVHLFKIPLIVNCKVGKNWKEC